MAKKYFVSGRVVMMAERMADKYNSMISEKNYQMEDADDNQYEVLKKEIGVCNERMSKIRLALNNVSGDIGSYKSEWKFIEILKAASNERGVLDNLLGINI